MSFARRCRPLQWMVLAWFPAVALACGANPDAADDADAGIDASAPLTQTFTVQQPAAPGLQQLINSCASGVQSSCLAMCRSMFCEFGEPGGSLRILACELRREGPFANITVTFDGRPECISPGIPLAQSDDRKATRSASSRSEKSTSNLRR